MKHETLAVLTLTMIVLSGCAHEDRWTRTDTGLYGAYVTTLVADGKTTSRIKDYPCLQESGIVARHILGAQPSNKDTAMYFGTLAISSYFIARALPKTMRKIYLSGNIAIHGYASASNYSSFAEGCN